MEADMRIATPGSRGAIMPSIRFTPWEPARVYRNSSHCQYVSQIGSARSGFSFGRRGGACSGDTNGVAVGAGVGSGETVAGPGPPPTGDLSDAAGCAMMSRAKAMDI